MDRLSRYEQVRTALVKKGPDSSSSALFLLFTFLAVTLFTVSRVGAQTSTKAVSALDRAEQLRRAAEQGIASAQFDLAVMYDTGTGVVQDFAQALGWYRKAAEQGYADAQFNLGVMYAKGAGVDRDDTEAAQWYRK